MLRLALSIALLVGFGPAIAGSVDAASRIDLVSVDQAPGQATLCVVLDERIDNRASVDRLRRKLNSYARYARSGPLLKDEPKSNPTLIPNLCVMVSRAVTPVERQNLEGIKLQYRFTDIRFTIETVELGRAKRHER